MILQLYCRAIQSPGTLQQQQCLQQIHGIHTCSEGSAVITSTHGISTDNTSNTYKTRNQQDSLGVFQVRSSSVCPRHTTDELQVLYISNTQK